MNQRRRSLPVRARRHLSNKGPTSFLQQVCKRLLQREKLIVVRRDLDQPLPRETNPHEELEVRRAEVSDREVWRESFPQKVDWYLNRLESGNQLCFLGLDRGKLATHCWFATGPYRDPVLCYTFNPGDGGAYQSEGWVAPAYRQQGLATRFINDLYARHLPENGVRHVLAHYAEDNEASHQLHQRFEFHEVGRAVHWKILRWHFTFRAWGSRRWD